MLFALLSQEQEGAVCAMTQHTDNPKKTPACWGGLGAALPCGITVESIWLTWLCHLELDLEQDNPSLPGSTF